MTFPRIHLNGTSAIALKGTIANATAALREAERALYETAPHGRDYYVIGTSAFSQAQAEHLIRLAKLQAVREELEAIWENLDEQESARNAQRA